MKHFILFILISVLIPHDDRYTESAAMSCHRTEPERALVIIDSAVIVGNLSWQRSEYLKAMTHYGGLHNMKAARQICLDMLEQKESLTDSITLEQTYQLLASIEYTVGNHPDIIRFATEASRLAHALGLADDIGRAEGLIAQSMAQTGRTDEGIERLQGTLAELRQLNTFKGVITYHDVSKKLIRIYFDNSRYADAVPVCKATLERIEELENHAERFEGIKEGFDPSEFVDFARGQILAFLTVAYARQGNLAEARKTEAEVFRTQWSQSIDCDKIMSAAYAYMGEYDRFEQAMRRFENSYPDTINPNYVICLEQRYEAARRQGQIDKALGYMQRAYLIRDSLDYRNQRDQLNELATAYRLNEEQLLRKQKEAEAERARSIIIALTIGLAAAISFLVWFFRQKRLVEKKNKVLAREIAEAITYKEKYMEARRPEAEGSRQEEITEHTAGDDPDTMLFHQIQELVVGEKLFLDPTLDRQMLVDRLGVSKERIGAAFAKGSPYKSLIEFLNDCRLPCAAKLLTTRPDLSIADVAKESGYANADTLGRNFKRKYALTPTEYKEQRP